MNHYLGQPVHKRLRLLLLALAIVFVAVGCHSSAQQRNWLEVSEDDMEHLLSLHDHDMMMSWVEELTGEKYGGREAGTEHEDLAGDYIVQVLQSLGLQPWREAGLEEYRHSFQLPRGSEPSENIVAVLPGRSKDEFLLIGAHYDHIGIIDGVYHPGADDNAVGTAAVLELARIFSQCELTPERTIVFVLFSGEEKGMIGSQALVEHLRQQALDDQVMLLNLDVIAGVEGDTLVVFDGGFRINQPWSNRAELEAEAAGVEAEISRQLAGGVDSMRFTEKKIPGITLVWGDLRENHPHLHLPTDTVENLNQEIVAAATRAAIRIAWAFAMR